MAVTRSVIGSYGCEEKGRGIRRTWETGVEEGGFEVLFLIWEEKEFQRTGA